MVMFFNWLDLWLAVTIYLFIYLFIAIYSQKLKEPDWTIKAGGWRTAAASKR